MLQFLSQHLLISLSRQVWLGRRGQESSSSPAPYFPGATDLHQYASRCTSRLLGPEVHRPFAPEFSLRGRPHGPVSQSNYYPGMRTSTGSAKPWLTLYTCLFATTPESHGGDCMWAIRSGSSVCKNLITDQPAD